MEIKYDDRPSEIIYDELEALKAKMGEKLEDPHVTSVTIHKGKSLEHESNSARNRRKRKRQAAKIARRKNRK